MHGNPKRDQVDIAVIVPKEDEFRAVEWAFGVQFGKSTGAVGTKRYYKHFMKTGEDGPLTSVAFVFMNDQGNDAANGLTGDVFWQLDPAVVFLVGTAAGRKGKIVIGRVVASNRIIDAQEWRIESGRKPRADHHPPPEQIRADMARFLGKTSLWKDEWQSALRNMQPDLFRGADPPNELWVEPPDAELGFVAAGSELILEQDFLENFWSLDDRIRCYDMESGGFGSKCKEQLRKQWLVVRGISDYGLPHPKKDLYRVAAASAAALLLRRFIERGLVEAHPRWVQVPESPSAELPSDSYYAKFDFVAYVVQGIREKLGIELRDIELGGSLSTTDFVSICVSKGADKEKAHRAVMEIREAYFTEKYLDYGYENDLRGLLPNWASEVKRILADLSVDSSGKVVADVGIGNGLEAPYLFADVGRLIAVDLSSKMLEEAKRRFPSLEPIRNQAEELVDIKTRSVDIYTSLRTYQSSMFDIAAALREARRVLKEGGVLIISIANGFVVTEDGQKRIVRGLLVPGSTRIVDKSTPRKIANIVEEKLVDLGFESVGTHSGKTDIYIWGVRT